MKNKIYYKNKIFLQPEYDDMDDAISCSVEKNEYYHSHLGIKHVNDGVDFDIRLEYNEGYKKDVIKINKILSIIREFKDGMITARKFYVTNIKKQKEKEFIVTQYEKIQKFYNKRTFLSKMKDDGSYILASIRMEYYNKYYNYSDFTIADESSIIYLGFPFYTYNLYKKSLYNLNKIEEILLNYLKFSQIAKEDYDKEEKVKKEKLMNKYNVCFYNQKNS